MPNLKDEVITKQVFNKTSTLGPIGATGNEDAYKYVHAGMI